MLTLKKFQAVNVQEMSAQQYADLTTEVEAEFSHHSKEMLKADKGRYNKNRSVIAQGKHVQKFIQQGLPANTPMSVVIAMTHTQQFII